MPPPQARLKLRSQGRTLPVSGFPWQYLLQPRRQRLVVKALSQMKPAMQIKTNTKSRAWCRVKMEALGTKGTPLCKPKEPLSFNNPFPAQIFLLNLLIGREEGVITTSLVIIPIHISIMGNPPGSMSVKTRIIRVTFVIERFMMAIISVLVAGHRQ